MLILITIIFILIGSLIMGSIYSIFSPFIENTKNIADYNAAYYGAISAIERSELVLKYHGPGFEGSGGYIGNKTENQRGATADKKNNFNNIEFGRLTKSSNGFHWNIKSKTTGQNPLIGQGNIDLELQTDTDTEAKNYNKLEPNMAEEIGLDLDDTTNSDKYYQTGYTTTRSVSNVNFFFRLNPKTYVEFGDLNTSSDNDKDGINNDAIITWSLAGTYNTDQPFTIQPYITYNAEDSMIREDIVNQNIPGNNLKSINFNTDINPLATNFVNKSNPNPISGNNTIPAINAITGATFYNIFGNHLIKGLTLKFSLVNLPISNNGNIYPFVEYKIDTGTSPIPDRFYHINGVGRVGNYEVMIKIEKPSFDTTTNSEFVIYF